jgi:hypothetical protein
MKSFFMIVAWAGVAMSRKAIPGRAEYLSCTIRMIVMTRNWMARGQKCPH